MKKRSLFMLMLPITSFALSACGGKQHLIVETESMHFKNQVVGTKFDPTGIKVRLSGSGSRIVSPSDWTVTGPEIIEGESWEATVHAEGYDDVVITGGTRDKVRVACVGDSLTYGHIWQSEAYPVYLQEYLGQDRFNIRNFGINGVSITGYGGSWNNPNQRYILKQEFKDSKDFNPDVIVMCLGTNDGTNWSQAAATFESYYHTLIDAYLEALPSAQWVFMVSPPCEEPNPYDINNTAMRDNVNPVQRALAQEYGFPSIDLREEFEAMDDGGSSMLRQENYNGRPDKVHFSKAGAQYVAERVKSVIDTFTF